MGLRNRVRSLRMVPANELVPNPRNWRTHPPEQAEALRGLLTEVGMADACLARELPDGSLMLIDGHLRAATAATAEVPVLILDVTEDEANKILVTLDPLAAMAGSDAARLDDLLRTVNTESEAVAALISSTAADAGLIPEDVAATQHDDFDSPQQFGVTVLCRDEEQQREVHERLVAEGFECKVLRS